MRGGGLVRRLGCLVAVAAALSPRPLSASFHQMNVVQVFRGTAADPDAQYVMLQMWATGQNLVHGQSLTVFNGDGSLAATYTFPSLPADGDLANGADQATILIGTAGAQTLFGVPMDLLVSPVSTAGGGYKICWAGTIDCVAAGNYTGAPTGTGTPFPLADVPNLALTRRLDICSTYPASATTLDYCDDTNDSANDFLLTLPAPKNNAGQSGSVPASTCGNGVLEGLEDCDDGNTTSGDGCSNVCRTEPGGIVPTALAADVAATNFSNGNGILEPVETATIRTSWKNTDRSPRALVGAATGLTGPAGPTYSIATGHADYGTIAAGDSADCGANCYRIRASVAGEPRPATHWDVAFDEILSGGGRKTWTIHVGSSFGGGSGSYLFYRHIETILHHGITVGCSPTDYCADDKVPRSQMAIFLARTLAGGSANIPVGGTVGGNAYNCAPGGVSLFSDVAPADAPCKAVHYIASQNVTGGCGGGQFCVFQDVTRAEMAIFVARGMVAPAGGAAVPLTYGPDPVTGLSYSCDAGSPDLHFTDILVTDSYCRHAHYLWAKGVVSGCTVDKYCASGTVTRGEMAKFLTNAFQLDLYAP